MGDSSGWCCGGSATRAHSVFLRAIALNSTCGAGSIEWKALYQRPVENFLLIPDCRDSIQHFRMNVKPLLKGISKKITLFQKLFKNFAMLAEKELP
jgi:hypothetical protein